MELKEKSVKDAMDEINNVYSSLVLFGFEVSFFKINYWKNMLEKNKLCNTNKSSKHAAKFFNA